MVVLSCVNLESGLVGLVSDSEPNSGSKHHLGALHVVIHHVLKSWLEGLFVNKIEVNSVISDDLDSYVSSYKVDLSSHVVELLVLGPETCLFVNFEEENGARRSHDQGLVKKQVHVAKIGISYLLKSARLGVQGVGSQAVALAIEGIANLCDHAVE